MATIGQRIADKALEILDRNPTGVQYSDLVRQIAAADNSLNLNTIYVEVSYLPANCPDQVYKPSRGFYRLTKYRDAETGQLKEDLLQKTQDRVKEEDFYEPFARWLVEDVEECTRAIPLGGNRFRDKWGTPDVIGKWASRPSDIIKTSLEIVSAEIKLDVSQLVTAFGQASAYCLFCHKVYLVVPEKCPKDEIARLDALCQVFGIGLVLFDSENPSDPKFTIRCRPRSQQPDLFYANRYLKLIEAEMFS